MQQLEHLQRLQTNIIFSSSDYQNVEILNNSVVYCDPPYVNTRGYLAKFDHARFWDWARNLKHPLFVSEYSIPSDFRIIGKWNRKTKLSAIGTTKTKPELLACNKIAYEKYFKK